MALVNKYTKSEMRYGWEVLPARAFRKEESLNINENFYLMTQILDSNKFGKLELNDIAEFEEFNNVVLPTDYKEFLVTYNGGKPSPNIDPTAKSDVQFIYGMVEEPYYASFFQHIDMFKNRIPSWYVPIANDSGGNLYLMSLFKDNHGTIAFWRHEEETEGEAEQYFDNMSIVANSFSQFLNQLVEE